MKITITLDEREVDLKDFENWLKERDMIWKVNKDNSYTFTITGLNFFNNNWLTIKNKDKCIHIAQKFIICYKVEEVM